MHAPYSRILVTGAPGFLGHHVVPALRQAFPASEVIPAGRRDYDLLDPVAVARMLAETRPDAVVHLAGKIGGIIANQRYPADFCYENLMINTQVFQACWKAGVKKLLTFMGGCSYPAHAVSPIGEDQMWHGYPQAESAAYSTAKMMQLVLSAAYRKQHGFNSVVLIPGNVYGEYDIFNEVYAHVIPALIGRFVEATDRGDASLACYGSGRPTRDFVYAADVAATVPWFIENYDSSEPVNISAGRRISIRELAETVKKATGFAGEIVWDTSKPDGQMDKIFAVSRLNTLGLSCDTSLEEGLRRTAQWFLKARKEGLVRL